MLSIGYLVYSVNCHDLWFTIATLVLGLHFQSQVNIDLAPRCVCVCYSCGILTWLPGIIHNIYTVISQNTLMGDELKWLLKEGGGCIVKSCGISLENTPTLHTV